MHGASVAQTAQPHCCPLAADASTRRVAAAGWPLAGGNAPALAGAAGQLHAEQLLWLSIYASMKLNSRMHDMAVSDCCSAAADLKESACHTCWAPGT